MTKITYQTLLNPEVTEFCDVMGDFFSKIERDLYKDLEKGQKLNDLNPHSARQFVRQKNMPIYFQERSPPFSLIKMNVSAKR